jgi:hypothetical protein
MSATLPSVAPKMPSSGMGMATKRTPMPAATRRPIRPAAKRIGGTRLGFVIAAITTGVPSPTPLDAAGPSAWLPASLATTCHIPSSVILYSPRHQLRRKAPEPMVRIDGRRWLSGDLLAVDVDARYAFDFDEPEDVMVTRAPERTQAVRVVWDRNGAGRFCSGSNGGCAARARGRRVGGGSPPAAGRSRRHGRQGSIRAVDATLVRGRKKEDAHGSSSSRTK